MNWMLIGIKQLDLIRRLEDLSGDGKGLEVQGEGGILVEGLGKTGYDITMKSPEWRQGYYTALMTAAKAAENVDGWVKDEERKSFFPPEYMVGPSNPNPKAVPVEGVLPPREEFCKPAFEAPDGFYLKILTTRGFSNGEKVAAAIAYGDWFVFKGLPQSAEEMYRWGLDIALSSLSNPDQIIKASTAVINEDAAEVTPNILKVATAIATNDASRGNLSSALPIFLSVLRARRAAAIDTAAPSLPAEKRYGIADILSPASKPVISPTGDNPFLRTPISTCEDAQIMNHIGEILFASTTSTAAISQPQQLTGIAWTREAVELAEKTATEGSKALSKDEQRRCMKCADAGLTNWIAMLQTLADQERARNGTTSKTAGSQGSWFGGLWGSSTSTQAPSEPNTSSTNTTAPQLNKYDIEAQEIEQRQIVLRRKNMMDHFWSLRGSEGGTWMGV